MNAKDSISAKDYLRKIHTMDIKIRHLQSEAMELREAAAKMTQYSDGEHIKSSKISDKMIFVDRCVDKEREIVETLFELQEYKSQVIAEIHTLTDERFIQILYMKYVEDKTLEEISCELRYDYKYACKVHGKALVDFEVKVLARKKTTNDDKKTTNDDKKTTNDD